MAELLQRVERVEPAPWSLTDDWPCPCCGLIGCEHDEDLPPYRGAFETEGRH